MAPRRSARGKNRAPAASLTMDDDEVDNIDISKPQISLDFASSDDSEDNSSEEEDSDLDDNNYGKDEEVEEDDEEEEDDSEADSDDDDDSDDGVDPETVWGKSSSQYYAGDTADLEIGQDFEEAKEEEAIAAKLQKKKRQTEDESDYLILDENNETGENDGEEDEEEGDGEAKVRNLRDVTQLGDAEQLKVILAESPELRGLLDQMKSYLDELSLLGMALDEAHMGQADIVTENGLAYLELRNHLLLSFVMNVNFYLLLKAENKPVRDHPVVGKLMKLQKAITKLGPLYEQGEAAVGYLVQKAAEEVLEGDDDDDDDDDDGSSIEEIDEDDEEEEANVEEEEEEEDEDDNEEEEDDEEEDEEETLLRLQKEKEKLAREKKRLKKDKKFEEKTNALMMSDNEKQKKKQSSKKRHLKTMLGNDMGDIEQEVDDAELGAVGGNARKLQAMMNTMIQKQKSKKLKANGGGDEDLPLTSTALMKGSNKPQSMVGSNEMNFDDPNHEFAMKDDQDDDDDQGDEFDSDSEYFKPPKQKYGNNDDKEANDDNQFYNEIKAASKSRASLRKEKYGATSRVAGAHVKELDSDAKRALSYQIMKNRGLVAHKSKINRNPRVKKREQFRKATIARKGQVRDIRDSAEGAHYQGEATGIRTNISRSRAITN